jgi:hypothetical protein
MSSVPDDFYGGSIYKDLHREPRTVINLHKSILKSNCFEVSKSNLGIVLTVSREIYRFIGQNGSEELKDYKRIRTNERQVKGPVVLHFDLVVELLTVITRYIHDHPKDTLEAAASLVVIEQFIEQKAGGICARLWRKMIKKEDSAMRKHIEDLSRLERRKRQRRQSSKVSTR